MGGANVCVIARTFDQTSPRATQLVKQQETWKLGLWTTQERNGLMVKPRSFTRYLGSHANKKDQT